MCSLACISHPAEGTCTALYHSSDEETGEKEEVNLIQHQRKESVTSPSPHGGAPPLSDRSPWCYILKQLSQLNCFDLVSCFTAHTCLCIWAQISHGLYVNNKTWLYCKSSVYLLVRLKVLWSSEHSQIPLCCAKYFISSHTKEMT